MLIGSRLKNARKAKGLTQEKLGELIGVGKSAICCYENETRNPTLDSIKDLMKILGVTSDYLIGADVIGKTSNNEYVTFTNEEVIFIEELRKDSLIHEILFDDPKRGVELIKRKIG